ncbi:hypothetical protein D3C72_2014880 [compost metagenome]
MMMSAGSRSKWRITLSHSFASGSMVWNSRVERLMDICRSGKPDCCRRARSRHDCQSTRAPNPWMSPASSASGMKSAGET